MTVETAGDGIIRIDGNYVRPGLAAFYLVVENGRAAFIDTGTTHAVPAALQALETAGIHPDAVDYILPTHVHLDHAGGSGALLRELPNARLVVHPRGARHLIDPARLIAGSTAVYGEAGMARLFGEVVPVPAGRVVSSTDGMALDLGGRTLRLLHTPGHALHHYCVWDEASGGLFTGDTFGISYREFDSERGPYLFATTTPVQLDPDAWLGTLDRFNELAPRTVHLTHYGSLGDVPALAARLREDLLRSQAIALAHAGDKEPQAGIRADLKRVMLADLAVHIPQLGPDRALALLAMDLDLNSQGWAVWLARRARRGNPS